MLKRRRSSLILRLLALSWQHRGSFILALTALGIGSGINLLFPEIIRQYVNTKELEHLLAYPTQIGALLIGLFALQGISFYVRSYFFSLIGQRVVTTLRSQLYEQILFQPLAFFDSQRVGDLVSRITADTAQVQDAVSLKVSVVVRYALQVIAGIVLMATISLRLTFLLLLGLPVLVGSGFILGRKLRRISKLQQQELGSTTSVIEESFSGARIIKAFGAENLELHRFENHNKAVLKLGISRSKLAAFFSSFVNFLMNCFLVGVVLYGASLVASQGMLAGDLTAFLLYAAIVAVSFAFLVGTYAELLQALGAAERVFEILDSGEHTANSRQSNNNKPEGKPFSVHFDRVSFRYPSRPEIEVLQQATFTIPAGKTTALVGPSGAGKSSVAALLLRFYEPTAGTIVIDQRSALQYDIDQLRARCAFVPQDAQLFGVTLAENLRYGRPDATLEELHHICELLDLSDLIKQLPHGLNTSPGDRAAQLSGGQKQRFAIARALIRKPDLLILDEATSALDSETEARVLAAITQQMRGKTVLVIAHRLATIRHADQILVLDQGSVSQVGTHENLASASGLYRSLVERQEL